MSPRCSGSRSSGPRLPERLQLELRRRAAHEDSSMMRRSSRFGRNHSSNLSAKGRPIAHTHQLSQHSADKVVWEAQSSLQDGLCPAPGRHCRHRRLHAAALLRVSLPHAIAALCSRRGPRSTPHPARARSPRIVPLGKRGMLNPQRQSPSQRLVGSSTCTDEAARFCGGAALPLQDSASSCLSVHFFLWLPPVGHTTDKHSVLRTCVHRD